MATAKLKRVEQDILTCSICLSKFTDPVTLTCQHSYCRLCIGAHIVTKSENELFRQILCPFCKQKIRVPAPTRPVEEWARQLKPSLVIQGLMDSLYTENVHEADQSPCFPCQRLGETTPGVMWCVECDTYLCDNCVQMHRVLPATTEHQLAKRGQEDMARRREKERCKKHEDKYIDIYCQDCDDIFCYSCFVDKHRNCNTVQSIESMIPIMKAKLAAHKTQLSEKGESADRRNKARKDALKRISRDKRSVQQAIKTSTQRVIDLAQKKERKLIEQLESGTEHRLQQLKDQVQRSDMDKQTLQQCCEYIDQVLGLDHDMDILRMFQAWKSGDLDCQDNVNTNTQQLTSVAFDETNGNLAETLANLRLGDIRFVEGPTPVFHGTTDSRVRSDQEKPALLDITVVNVGGVRTTVVTDYKNTCVKSLFTKHNHVSHSILKLDSTPWGITKLKENQVMVVVYDTKQIVTLAVTPDLVLLSTVHTGKGYYSLAVLSPTTIAAGRNKYVDILNMQGQVMKSLSTHNNVELFSRTYYMCVDKKGNLLVSDRYEKCVTCVTPGGSVVWRYHPAGERALKIPNGITTTHRGDILLVDRDARKVIQLSESGQYVRDVLTKKDGLKNPQGMCVDSCGSVFVTDNWDIKEFVFM